MADAVPKVEAKKQNKNYLVARNKYAQIELGTCNGYCFDLSYLCQNWLLIFCGTGALVLWIVCVVAAFSMKSAIHVYKFNHQNSSDFLASGREGDHCWDKDAFLHLGPIEYLNGRLSLLALGVLPAAAWSAMQILNWCAGITEAVDVDILKRHELDREIPEDDDPAGLKCFSCCPQTCDFSTRSFQTTLGVTLFNRLGVFALIMDSFAVKQWDMGSCKGDIDKLKGENGKEMYDPTMPGFDFKNLPWLLMCTNLLALAMGTITLSISCSLLSRQIDKRFHKKTNEMFNKEKDKLLAGYHESFTKAAREHFGEDYKDSVHGGMFKDIQAKMHHHHGNHNGTTAAGGSQFLPEVRHMGGYRPVYAAWPV